MISMSSVPNKSEKTHVWCSWLSPNIAKNVTNAEANQNRIILVWTISLYQKIPQSPLTIIAVCPRLIPMAWPKYDTAMIFPILPTDHKRPEKHPGKSMTFKWKDGNAL